MKIVINTCFGGFSLSPLAVQEWAKRKGRKCFFFKYRKPNGELDMKNFYHATVEDLNGELVWVAFDTQKTDQFRSPENWGEMSLAKRKAHNANYERHRIEASTKDRTDKDLVAVVEKLGAAANGTHASLKIVNIPRGVKWTIEEYDGNEHVAEVHRTWS